MRTKRIKIDIYELATVSDGKIILLKPSKLPLVGNNPIFTETTNINTKPIQYEGMAVVKNMKPRISLSNQVSLYTAHKKPTGKLATITKINETAASFNVLGMAIVIFSNTVRSGVA